MATFVASSDVAPANGVIPRLIVKLRNEILQFDGPNRQDSAFQLDRSVFASNASALRVPPVYDPYGIRMCLVPENGNITIHNSVTAELIAEIPIADAQRVEFSPRGTYLITFSAMTPMKSGETADTGNLRIWKTDTAELVSAFNQKTYRSDSIQWTEDEEYCFKQNNNEISIYRAENCAPSEFIEKVHHKGFINFKVARDKQSGSNAVNIAVFNPEAQGKPAKVTIYSLVSAPNMAVQGPLNTRTIFGASEASLMWSPSGHVLLVHSQSDVDSSNASYYGATSLYLLLAQGDVSQKVEQSKEGPIHDVKWSPTENKFVVSAGNMPCQSTLYNDKGEPIYHFGVAHRNTISFAPHGRFICIAGFGNLQGEMDFYDILRLKKLGSNSSHCATTYGWSPCSRYFMTATLAPRMNVDNCVKLFTYAGVGPVVHEPFDRAFNAFWRPAPPGTYPDRPATPRRQQEAESRPVTTNTAPVAAAPYRPPHSTGSLATFMNKQQQDEAVPAGKVKKATPTGNNASGSAKFVPSVQKQRVIPGMPTSAQAKKPANNTNNSGSKANNAPVTAGNTNNANNVTKKPVIGSATTTTTTTTTQSTPQPTASVAISVEEKEKRSKAISKKLKQIQDIKDKQAGGHQLDADQMKKLQSEASLLEELNSLK